ncbi:fibroblast growth factor receptor 4-like isoform X2 [Aricia agestis]|uniref:fibroblast growth factor receptor 4-like isoform X2 n=1 Tax=Aricia agestis TaxID=91739 RepID=UPI001C20250F|nr:fibroblast growth factor receptor 4-like isoform X2 [Aricia agestis]
MTLPALPPSEYPVVHAALPRGVAVFPLPLGDHELAFNVTWNAPVGPPVRGYSIEVHSVTDTADCHSNLCYEYNLPGDTLWSVIPTAVSPVPDGCAVRPGCAYQVRLIAHPWDGHTVANINVELDECVVGVCSCAHAPRLPRPRVSAELVSIGGELVVNVTWSLPPPEEPLRLPPRLKKRYYYVSIGKQMVSDAHPAPWFAHTVSRRVDTFGFVTVPEDVRWFLLPISDRSAGRSRQNNVERNDNERSGVERSKMERSGMERSGEVRSGKSDKQSIVLDVKLLARVNLIDERGCVGPAGNATAYDPTKTASTPFKTFVIWTLVCCACVLMVLVLAVFSARAVKRVLQSLRPSADPLQPLCVRPAWFQFAGNGDVPTRGRVEESPLYTHKDFPPMDAMDAGDEWEVSRCRVQLGGLIGSGAFGRVHAAQLLMPGGETVTVAAKMLSDHATEDEMQDFLREIAMLKHVGSHKHVIRLVGCCTLRPPLIALLEHAPRGDLLTLLRAARGKSKPSLSDDANGRPSEADTEYTNLSDGDAPEKLYVAESQEHYVADSRDSGTKSRDHYVAEPALHLDSSTMRDYALQVALGMRHLEEKEITHRDLAARNILVDGAGVLKVADFGLSRSGVYVHTRARPVPLRWLAPEAIYSSQYCSASDVWAFAVLLWEIATLGGFPYAELSNQKVPQFLTEGGRLPRPARASPRLYGLMLDCWSDEPQARPTFAQIVTKLTAEQQLYVDLDNVFSPLEDHSTSLSDYDFSFKE